MRSALALSAVAAALAVAATPSRPAPPFVAHAFRVTAAELRFSYRPGCPVAPAELRRVRIAYWGFDGGRHLGDLVVRDRAVPALETAFRRLYAARFPLRHVEPVDRFRGSDDASMAADNTSAFNCRYAVASGPKRWSVHAYGEAIDVNPVENPYLEGRHVLPPAGRRYLDRSRARPGMAVPGGELVDTFAAVGWQWGGRWSDTPDYQHFSATGG
jgi:hypothetical protein